VHRAHPNSQELLLAQCNSLQTKTPQTHFESLGHSLNSPPPKSAPD
jgi:hypothetical protein